MTDAFLKILEILGEKIKSLELDVYIKNSEIKTLKSEIQSLKENRGPENDVSI